MNTRWTIRAERAFGEQGRLTWKQGRNGYDKTQIALGVAVLNVSRADLRPLWRALRDIEAQQLREGEQRPALLALPETEARDG